MEKFVKQNNSSFKDALLKEKDGLELLNKELKHNDYIFTPKVFNVNENSLEIEKIDSIFPTKELSKQFGIGLAKLHKKTYDSYGYNTNNYIGLNLQKNSFSKNWGEFFITNRLLFQIELIKDSKIKNSFINILQKNSKRLEDFLNQNSKHPSLVHGDLWSGNVLYSQDKIYLIDPAIYYGDREVDIAMTEVFGGFDEEFYNAYNEIYPLSGFYQKKKVIYNLYHYLNHYNLFGSGYLNTCQNGFDFIENSL